MLTIGLMKNTLQKYAWGSTSAIQALLGDTDLAHEPAAELWMGAHPKAPSLVRYKGQWMSLTDLIARQPQAILGSGVAEKFNHQLPYLFKVLAAAKPLSIQAHPGLEQARQGFENENKKGIPLNAAHRNYKDPNHKPECICALSAFWALYGFRKISDILLLMGSTCPVALENELEQLKTDSDAGGLKLFFTKLMTMAFKQRKQVIDEVTRQVQQRREENPAYDWTARLAAEYPDDIGLLAPLFLNLIRLNPGQALFLPAGELHAYLEGTGIELMANSDNVLRGGLTPKHIDVAELLKVLNFKPRRVEILQARHKTATEKIYVTPAEEFTLSAISVSAGFDYHASDTPGAEILLCIEGEGRLEDDGSHVGVHIKKGDSAIISAATGSYSLKGEGAFYKAAVPV
ncbi:MAG: mannose-6-phosphate isomerase, class I [Desulfobacterales bacterium]